MNCVITGEKNVGKTTVVKRVVTKLRDRGLNPVGFYTEGGPDLLELVLVKSKDRVPFGSRRRDFPGDISVGRFSINPAAIRTGLKAIEESGDFLVIDEIGKMEREGEGFAPLLEELDPTTYRGTLLSVRKGVESYVEHSFPREATVSQFEITETNRDNMPDKLIELFVGNDT